MKFLRIWQFLSWKLKEIIGIRWLPNSQELPRFGKRYKLIQISFQKPSIIFRFVAKTINREMHKRFFCIKSALISKMNDSMGAFREQNAVPTFLNKVWSIRNQTIPKNSIKTNEIHLLEKKLHKSTVTINFKTQFWTMKKIRVIWQ